MARHLDPKVEMAWWLAQGALSVLAMLQTGRPFHALSAARQDALLRRWEDLPILRSLLAALGESYKFVHFDARPTYEQMGGKFRVVKTIESPRWL